MCKSNIGQTQKTGLFVRNIAGKLANEIPEIRNYMDTENVQMSVKKSRCAANPYTCLDIAVIQPLKFTYTIPPHKRIFLVSGLDECGHMVHGNHTTIPKLLGIKLNDFPPWIKFLFISRDEQTVLKYFPTLQKHNIEMKDLRQLSRTYNKKNSEKKT